MAGPGFVLLTQPDSAPAASARVEIEQRWSDEPRWALTLYDVNGAALHPAVALDSRALAGMRAFLAELVP